MFVFIVIMKLLNLQLFTFLPDLNDTLYKNLRILKIYIYIIYIHILRVYWKSITVPDKVFKKKTEVLLVP